MGERKALRDERNVGQGAEKDESQEKKKKKKVREKEMTLGQCVGPLFFSFLVKNITE